MIPEAAPASKPTDIPPRGWKEIAKATWKEAGKDNVSIIAAGVAFYIFTALVPLLTAIVLTYGLVADPADVEKHMQTVTASLPQGSGELVAQQLHSMVQTSGGKTGFALILALLIALYGASKMATSLMTAMNIAWGVEDKRGFIKRTLIAIAMVVGMVVAILSAALAISAMGLIEDLLPALGGVAHFFLQLLGLLVAAGIVMVLLAAFYRYAPDRPDAKWQWVSPGSILATIVWALATVGFGFYVSNFGSYNATYGALGAVIVFLTWLYLTAYIILLGAEMNAVLEQEVAAAPQANQGQAKQASGAQAKSGTGAATAPVGKQIGEAQSSDPLAYPAEPKPQETQPPSAGALMLRFGLATLMTSLLGGSAKRREPAAASPSGSA
jgi:membrane protein